MKNPYKNLTNKLSTLSLPITKKDAQYLVECITHCQLERIQWQRKLLQEDMGDDWLSTCDILWQEYMQEAKGHLYLAVNPSDPAFYKFGKAKDAVKRRNTLNNAAVLNELIIVATWEVCNRHKLETLIRKELGKKFPLRKEFVQASYNELHPLISKLVNDYTILFSNNW
jgi:predicted negative regulator of RcsB-dependent stress response